MSEFEPIAPDVHELAGMAPDNMKGVADSLADELDFMQKTLKSLKAHIAENGAVEWYENGRQQHWRESPAMKAYTALIPRYNATIKQLVALVPNISEDMGDELDEWLREN